MEPGVTDTTLHTASLARTGHLDRRAQVLFLAAEPNARALANHGAEAAAIERRLEVGPRGGQLAFVHRRVAEIDDLVDLMLRHRPRVVHVAGHCTRDGAVVLADSSVALALLEICRLLRGDIECVFLNAGGTDRLASAIADHVDCAVGVHGTWSPRAAALMAEYFYGGVGHGNTAQQAFEVGRLALSLHDCDDADAPRMYARDGFQLDHLVLAR